MELNQASQPLVTVITPLYNAQNYIAETVESVINQTYQNWEMIIVDDCSTDNSRKIVKEYEIKDIRIKLIESESNFGGPARPRNIGIDNAKGEYIAFLDADDVWNENKIKEQINFMLDNKLAFSSTNENLINEQNEFLTQSIKERLLKYITKKHDFDALLFHNFIVNSSVMVKKELVYKHKFDEDKMLIAIEDYYLWLEFFMNKYKYGYVNDDLVSYRILHNSAVQRNNKIKNQARRNYALSKLCLKYESIILLRKLYKLNFFKYLKGFI